MIATNNIYSLSNFTLLDPSPSLFTPASTSKNYSASNLDFTLSVPASMEEKFTKVFNQTMTSPTFKHDILSPLVVSGSGVIADFSGHIRQDFSIFQNFFGTESPDGVSPMGLTSGFNLVSGGLNIKSAIKEIQTAQKISDTAGKALGYLKMARGTAQAVGGALIIPVRALSIAALQTSSKIISTSAGILGSIGSACFNFVSALSAIGLSLRLKEQHQFRSGLNAILKDPNLTEQTRPIKALEFLKQLVTIQPQEKEEIRKAILEQPESSSLSPQQISDQVDQQTATLLTKKEAYLKRLTDEDCLTQIQQKGPAEAMSVVEAVEKNSTEKIILAVVGIVLNVIGLATTAASFVFTSPAAILVTAVIGLATSLGWLLTDAYGLIKEFQSADPGRYDKLWIFVSTVLAVVSVAIVFFVSGGTAAIATAAVIGIFWLAVNFACYYRLYHMQQQVQNQELQV